MIPVLYEDDDILAVDKPAGIASIPEREKGKESLLGTLMEERHAKLYIVHRLDKEVSGVMMFAKSPEAHKFLNEEFFERRIKKTYIALVLGSLQDDCGVVDRPIRQFGSGRMGVDERHGKPSRTEYRVSRRFASTTLLELNPTTGRRHQLRVHCYSIGHPVVGDMRYGAKEVQRQFSRLLLHAARLQFVSTRGDDLIISSPLPASFLHSLEVFEHQKS